MLARGVWVHAELVGQRLEPIDIVRVAPNGGAVKAFQFHRIVPHIGIMDKCDPAWKFGIETEYGTDEQNLE